MILAYQIVRGPEVYEAFTLCDRHVEARKILGWSVGHGMGPGYSLPRCLDCEKAKEPTVLDRVIEATEAEADDTPAPVEVLPGQRSLW